jgi:CHASE2 domain-containing sensor protein/anti-sigma regulatory factor (Ser/Thr protein kinase)
MWREMLLTGAVILGLVLLIRMSGFLQVQEWMVLDSFSRACPYAEGTSSVVVVGIDEMDLSFVGGYPVPDRTLAAALKNLQAYKPSAIALDLFRDMPVEPGHTALVQALQTMPNVIGTEVALNRTMMQVSPFPGFPPERIGFVDAIVDADGKLRRSLLVGSTAAGQVKHSLVLKLAQTHLATRQVSLSLSDPQSSDRASAPLRFGSTALPRFRPNSGGYINADATGNQLLLSFCGTQKMVRSISLQDVLENKVNSDWIQDHVVLIGMTSSSIKDVFFTSALRETLNSYAARGQTSMNQVQMPANQVIYAVEAHAYAVHQIIEAVLNQYPLITSWAEPWEYLWIIAWGCLGLALGVLFQSPWKSLLSLAIASLILIMLCHLLLQMMGWWLPLVPALLTLCGCGLSASFFDRNLRFELEYRRLAIERTYEAVHNGPLQHLAVILRSLEEENHSLPRLEQQLWLLNEEMRRIFEHMRQEVSTQYSRLYLRDDLVLDLETSIVELLYQVYNHTRAEELPGLTTIQTFIPPNFALLKANQYSIEQKRGLCLFLHEALFNIGKHAIGATRLDVVCTVEAGWYVLRVIDNGLNITDASPPMREGQGTLQAKAIARALGGHFSRYAHSPHGVVCKLTWRKRRNWRRRFRTLFLPQSANPMP